MHESMRDRIRRADPCLPGSAGGHVDELEARRIITRVMASPPATQRRPLVWVTVGGLVAVIMVAAVAWPRPRTALAWSPSPAPVDAADADLAASVCRDGLGGEVSVQRGPQGGPDPSEFTELPPLVSLDVRGDLAVALHADDRWEATCLLKVTASGFEPGPIFVTGSSDTMSALAFRIEWAATANWPDGSRIAVVHGFVPAGHVVTLDVPGLGVAEATTVDGRFSIWWPGDLSAGWLTALAPDSTVSGRIDLASAFSTRRGALAPSVSSR